MVLRKRIILKGRSYSEKRSLINPGTNQLDLMFRETVFFFFLAKAPKTSLNITKCNVRVSPFPYHLIINSSGFRISVLIRELAPAAALNNQLNAKTASCNHPPQIHGGLLMKESIWKATRTLRPSSQCPMAGARGLVPLVFSLASNLNLGSGEAKQGEGAAKSLPGRI